MTNDEIQKLRQKGNSQVNNKYKHSARSNVICKDTN